MKEEKYWKLWKRLSLTFLIVLGLFFIIDATLKNTSSRFIFILVLGLLLVSFGVVSLLAINKFTKYIIHWEYRLWKDFPFGLFKFMKTGYWKRIRKIFLIFWCFFMIILGILLIITFVYSLVNFDKIVANYCEIEGNQFGCIVDDAIKNDNFSLCEQFDELNKTICYTMIGVELKDTSICENLNGEYDIDFCYMNIIERMDGFKDCEKLEGKNEAKCIGYAGLLMLSSGECEKEKGNSRELCFELVAKYVNESNLCDKVDEQHKGLCDKYLKNNLEISIPICNETNQDKCDRSCNSNSDCINTCPMGCINKNKNQDYKENKEAVCELTYCKCITNKCETVFEK